MSSFYRSPPSEVGEINMSIIKLIDGSLNLFIRVTEDYVCEDHSSSAMIILPLKEIDKIIEALQALKNKMTSEA